MPFKSQAQRRKFAEMLVNGEISAETFEEWNRETGSAKLPERVEHKPAKKRKASSSKKKAGSSTKRKTSPAKKATSAKKRAPARKKAAAKKK